YQVEYVPFEELSLQDLRAYHYSEKKFNCANCSASIAVKTYPYAQSCSCAQCGMTYELKNGIDLQKAGLRKEEGYIFIPLGSTGKINDIDYEVIGYVRKEEQNEYKSQWSEYTLFNPQHGFAFLSEYQGHWIYLREQGDSPILTSARHKQLTYDKETFQLYNS
ncbi:PF13785 domain protein, partial [Porphyromonas gingivalis JCVI SC001]